MIFLRFVHSISVPGPGFVGACPQPFLSTTPGYSQTEGRQVSITRSKAISANARAGRYFGRLRRAKMCGPISETLRAPT